MLTKYIKPGDRVDMIRYEDVIDSTNDKRAYLSKLLDINDEYTIELSVPIESGHLVPLEAGERYELMFISSTGVYICKSEILDRYKKDKIYCLKMKLLSDLRKNQRRQFYRLDKILNMNYHELSDQERILTSKLDQLDSYNDCDRRKMEECLENVKTSDRPAIVSNISGGGIRFSTGEQLHAGDIVRIRIELEENENNPVVVNARIITADSIANRNLRFENRAEFVNIDRIVRERLVRFVFKEERKQRQNDKGLF